MLKRPCIRDDDTTYKYLDKVMHKVIVTLKKQNMKLDAHNLAYFWEHFSRDLMTKQEQLYCPYCMAPINHHTNCQYCGQQFWDDEYE